MSIISVDHIAITVSDMERSLGLYRDLLGFEVMGQMLLKEGSFKIVYLQAGDARIELFEFADKGSPVETGVPDEVLGFKHIGLTVEDVDEVASNLKAAGVHFTVDPKMASSGGIRLAFFHDPDGNLLELTAGTLNLKPYEAKPPTKA